MTSPAPLTEAERLTAEALAAVGNRDYVWAGPGYFDASDWEDEARAVVAAVQPVFAAEFYEAMAEATENCGPMSAEGFRGLAIMARLCLSLPASKETQQ